MSAEDKQAKEILEKYNVFVEAPFNKLKCIITGHELKPTSAILKEYTSTKKFQTAWAIHEILVQHPDVFEDLDEKLLGCKLTKKVLSRDPATLTNHLEGKKFKKALQKVASGELNVDDDEDSDISNMSDIEMDDEDVTDIEKDEDEDDVEIDDDDDEGEDYPELSKGKKGEALPLAEDSYDFSVMDTEKDTRKRKTKGKGTVDKKKKTKKA